MKYIYATIVFTILVMCNGGNRTTETAKTTKQQSVAEKSEAIPVADWVKVKCEHLCDDEKGKFPSRETLKEHLGDEFYDLVKREQNDSIFIAFNFIKDCCMDFTGTASIREDTLLLTFLPAIDSSRCDCLCDYRMHYRINKKDEKWSVIKPVYKTRSL